MKDLRGKIVLITGAGSGLGRLMAIEFAAEGISDLILWDIRMDLLEETKGLVLSDIRVYKNNRGLGGEGGKSQISGNGEGGSLRVLLQQCDLSKREAIYKTADEALTHYPDGIDVLVNNAGIVSGKPFLEVDDSLVIRTMEVNSLAHMWLAKRFLPPMIKKNQGHIVTIASAAGLVGTAGLADYAASKFAAIGFDEAIRFELRKLGKTASGVKTTVVAPFYTNTGMFTGVKTKVNWLLPILDPTLVVSKIIEAVKKDKAVLYIPKLLHAAVAVKAISPRVGDWLVSLLGISSSMDDFKGRGTQWALGSDVRTSTSLSSPVPSRIPSRL